MAIYNNDRGPNEVSWERVVTRPNDTLNVKPGVDHGYGDYDPPKGGLTKREYFAAMAMQGLLSNPAQIDTTDFKWIASHAVGYADALIKALNEQN